MVLLSAPDSSRIKAVLRFVEFRPYLLGGHEITIYQPATPGTYLAETGMDVSTVVCLSLAFAGLVLVLLLEYAAGNLGRINPDRRA